MRLCAYWTAVLLSLAPLALGACASDPAARGDAPSKKEFAHRAYTICRNLHYRLKRLHKPHSPAKFRQRLRRIESLAERAIGQLRLLEKPTGKAGVQAQELLDALDHDYVRRLLPRFRQLDGAAHSRDAVAFLAGLKRLKAIKHLRSDRLAARFGIPNCERASSAPRSTRA